MASYRYSPSSSPWSRRTLIVLWSTQLLYTILTTIVSLAIVGGMWVVFLFPVIRMKWAEQWIAQPFSQLSSQSFAAASLCLRSCYSRAIPSNQVLCWPCPASRLYHGFSLLYWAWRGLSGERTTRCHLIMLTLWRLSPIWLCKFTNHFRNWRLTRFCCRIPSGAQLLYASVVLQKFRNTARIAKLVDGVDMGKPQRLAGEELAIGNGEIKWDMVRIYHFRSVLLRFKVLDIKAVLRGLALFQMHCSDASNKRNLNIPSFAHSSIFHKIVPHMTWV